MPSHDPTPHLALALDGTGWHPASWREPGARPAELLTAGYWTELVQEAERGLLDLVGSHQVPPLRSRVATRAARWAPSGQPRSRPSRVSRVARTASISPGPVSAAQRCSTSRPAATATARTAAPRSVRKTRRARRSVGSGRRCT